MADTATQKVGQEIRRARIAMGLSQRELGALINKSATTIGEYENATSSITLDVLFRIAEVTGIAPEAFIAGVEEKEAAAGWDAELRIYQLDDRKTVMAILATNGYDVGQHKKKVTPDGKAVAYYVHVTDQKDNADTSRRMAGG